jgi:hypothetical protein
MLRKRVEVIFFWIGELKKVFNFSHHISWLHPDKDLHLTLGQELGYMDELGSSGNFCVKNSFHVQRFAPTSTWTKEKRKLRVLLIADGQKK